MSLQHVAKHLEDHGRGPDSKLVHMSDKELAGLQSLAQAHGKSLTRNPHTGLPEAGVLDSLLPAALGIGTAIFAPELLPFVAGGGGLYDYAKTGDVGKGLMTGLSIYSGGNLAESLAASGAASGAAANTAAQLGVEGASAAPGSQAALLAEQNAGMGDAGLQSVRSAASTAEGVGQQAAIPSNAANMAQGFSNVTASPSAATDFAKANWKSLAGVTVPALLAQPPNSVGAIPGQTPDTGFNATRLDPNYHPYQPAQPSPAYQAQYRNYVQNPYTAATGGIVALAGGGMAMGGQPGQMYPMSQQEHTNFMDPTQLPASAMAVREFEPATNPMTGDMTQAMASGGSAKSKKPSYTNAASLAAMSPWDASKAQLNNAMYQAQTPVGVAQGPSVAGLGNLNLAHGGETYNLGSYSDGGRLLKGPGDGMSDNIPAKIGKHQPARLAEGEFVVPADVVSHLGNGSTDAGAKRLYAMMDKVRKARTGNPKQGKQIKAEKYLPT